MTCALTFAAAVCLLPRPDADGLPVPAGAVHRLGSARMQTAFSGYALAPGPDGATVLSCGWGGWATAFDTATGRPKWTIRIGKGMLSAAAYTADGKHVYLAEQPGYGNGGVQQLTVHRRDAATGAAVDTQTVGTRNGGYNAAFDAAGTVAVTAAAGQHLVIQDLATKKVVKQYGVAQNNWPGTMAVGPGGKTVAAMLGNKLFVYDAAAGADGVEVKDAGDNVNGLAISPDGTKIAAVLIQPRPGGGTEGWLRLFDRAGAKLAERKLGTADGPEVGYGTVTAYAPDGKTIAVGGYARDVQLFGAANLAPLRTLAGPIGTPLVFSRDGATVFAGSQGIQMWGSADGKRRPASADMAGAGYHGRIEFAGDAVTLSGQQRDDRVMWNWRTGRELARMPGAEAAAQGYADAFAWYMNNEPVATRSRDGKRLARRATGSAAAAGAVGPVVNPSIEVVDAATGRVTARVEEANCRELVFTADGAKLVVCDGDHANAGARVYDAATGKKLFALKPPDGGQNNIYLSQQSLSAAPVGDLIAIVESHAFNGGGLGSSGNAVRFTAGVYDAGTGRRVTGIAETGMVQSLAWSEDGTRVVVAGNIGFDSSEPDGFFGVVDPLTGRWVVPHTKSTGGVGRPALSPDGKLLAVATDTGVQLWEVGTGKLRCALPGPRLRDAALAFAPDNRHLVAFGSGQAGLVFDTAAHRPDAPTADAEADWAALTDADPAKAYAAMARLAAGGDAAVAVIRAHLPAVAPPDPVRLRHLLELLDSPKYADRERGAKELRALGELAAPAVKRTLETSGSAEVRERAGKLLAAVPKPTPDAVRAARAVEVLAWSGTPAAKAVLAALAAGAEGAALTRDAQRAGK